MKRHELIASTTRTFWSLSLLLALSMACANAVRAQTAEDEALWKKLDITEDGWLDGKELDGGWKKYDADGDTEVTKAEFMAGRAKERPAQVAASAEDDSRLFKQLDISGNGLLTGKELEVANVRTYDANGDGRVTNEEFVAARTQLRLSAVNGTKAAPVASNTNNDEGLLTQAEILRFLSARMGTEPFKNPQREAILKELAEMIKRRGLDFRDELRSDFRRQALKFSTSSEVSFALQDNYGAPTKQNWLMGAWVLGKTSAAVDFVKKDELWRQNEFGVKDVGSLTLNPNGTYVWQNGKETLRGAWRKATSGEMRTQGGDGVVLLKAKATWDWIVMHNRAIELKGDWIYVKELGTRQVKEFGSRNADKK